MEVSASKEESAHVVLMEAGLSAGDVERLLGALRAKNPDLVIQAFTARRTPNPAALKMVAAQTLAALDSGTTLAKRPELDLLLRIAGTRQIGEAIKGCGYKASGGKLYLVAASGRPEALQPLGELEARFRRVEDRPLVKRDLVAVERAALLAAEA